MINFVRTGNLRPIPVTNISSKNYVLAFFAISFFVLSSISLLGFKSIFINRSLEEQFLYLYQEEKLSNKTSEELNQIETIFVGDSSLGYAIDAEYFSKISNSPSLVLALSGNYGFAGSYNMVKRFGQRENLKNVVIIQTIDIYTRPVAYDGYFFSMANVHDFLELDIQEKSIIKQNFFSRILSFQGLKQNLLSIFGKSSSEHLLEKIVNDYVIQGEKLDVKSEPLAYEPSSLNDEKLTFLLDLIHYCKEHDLNCIYIHGPVWDKVLDNSSEYLDHLNQILISNKVPLLDSIVSVPDEDIGDTYDHVAPEVKKEYTKKFYEIIKSHLRR